MSIYKIYKITNAVNGKVYIGQTKDSLHRRFQGHCWKSSGCIKLKHAIQKYGKENFYIEEIDHAESVAEANHKEVFWIDYYKSQDNRFGYNILQGGVICKYNRKKVICLETGEVFDSVLSAAKRYSVYRSSIYDAIDCGHRCKGLHFNYYKKGDIREFL